MTGESAMQPKVTIIIPAFNAQQYIERLLDSILNQTYRNLRVIVVDDGSKDNTPAILRKTAQRDERLTVLSVPNGGPALARNRALDVLPQDTEYIMFSDADDVLRPDMIEKAVESARGADLALLGFRILNSDGSESLYFEPEQHLTKSTAGTALGRLYKANLLNQVWAKLFRASLIQDNGIRFPDYRWGEDRLFIFDCLERAESVAVVPDCGYCYIMHPGESLITRYYDRKPEVCLKADERMESLCSRFAVTDDADFRYMFVKSIFSCMTTLFSEKCGLERKEKREVIRKIIENERVQARSRDTFGGAAVKALCAVMHTKSVGLNYAAFRFVAFAGSAAPGLFTKLKHRK